MGVLLFIFLSYLIGCNSSSQFGTIKLNSIISDNNLTDNNTTSGKNKPLLLWSSPSTWADRRVPQAHSDVLIPKDKRILLDVSTDSLASLTIEGELIFDDKDLQLTAKWIMVHGLMQIGTESSPFSKKAEITLTGSDQSESIMGMGTRGLLVMSGALEIHGQPPMPTWTKVDQHVEAGTTQLHLLGEGLRWNANDQIAIAPTDFFRIGRSELNTISAIDNIDKNRISLSRAVTQPRWGVLQYVHNSGVDAGISLTPSTAAASQALDERAEVANLSRNIVIQGIDDNLWRENGFGAHIMVMNPGVAHINGVHLKRMGQAGKMARYPFHWHLWSYNSDGTERGDATGQYFNNSVVYPSAQRCIVIHGTNGVVVDNNICFDIHGHGIFLEDAVERRNSITRNLVLNVNPPLSGKVLLNNELSDSGGPAAFWLTNPDNIIEGNTAADIKGQGFWYAIPKKPLGLNKKVPIEPEHLEFGKFQSNTAHSNSSFAFQIDNAPMDDAGNLYPNTYFPVLGGLAGTNIWAQKPVQFTISRLTAYKQEENLALWNRARVATFDSFNLSDFAGTGFSGASQQCIIQNSVVIGKSLNNRNSALAIGAVGAASYHSQCDIKQNVFVNLPAIPGKPSGAFNTSDYYITGVDKGLFRNTDNIFINTHPGYRTPSPNLYPPLNSDGSGTTLRENFSLAGALWDPHGLWGNSGWYWVYDHPFLTSTENCSDIKAPHNVQHNDKSCKGPYYGFSIAGRPDHPWDFWTFNTPILFKRLDNAAEWFIDDGNCTWRLGGMRFAAMLKDQSFSVSFPAGQSSDLRNSCGPGSSLSLAAALPNPKRLSFTVTNLMNTSDGFLISLQYSGAISHPIVYRTTWPNALEISTLSPYGAWASWLKWKSGDISWKTAFRGEFWNPITEVNSLSEVQSNSSGLHYWQDKTNNRIWLLIRSTETKLSGISSGSEIDLYNPVTFVIDSPEYY